MEVTKWLKPSESVSRIGDSASVQAVTRVNAECASQRLKLEGAFWQVYARPRPILPVRKLLCTPCSLDSALTLRTSMFFVGRQGLTTIG
jgi:hypothetical protein